MTATALAAEVKTLFPFHLPVAAEDSTTYREPQYTIPKELLTVSPKTDRRLPSVETDNLSIPISPLLLIQAS